MRSSTSSLWLQLPCRGLHGHRLYACCGLEKLPQQAEGVPIARDRLWACPAMIAEMFGEEHLQMRPDERVGRLHCPPPEVA